MVNKVEKDGKIAILVSHGFGAGWSTWGDQDSEAKLFCPEIVNAILGGASSEDLTQLAGRLFKSYNGGADQLRIHWIDKGTAFRVTEYDGSEDLEIISEIDYYIA